MEKRILIMIVSMLVAMLCVSMVAHALSSKVYYKLIVTNLIGEKVYYDVYWIDAPPLVAYDPFTGGEYISYPPRYVGGGEIKGGDTIQVFPAVKPGCTYGLIFKLYDGTIVDMKEVSAPIGAPHGTKIYVTVTNRGA